MAITPISKEEKFLFSIKIKLGRMIVQILNIKQIKDVFGGLGCQCVGQSGGKILVSEQACHAYCCEQLGSMGYMTFQDGRSGANVDLVSEGIPYHAHACPNYKLLQYLIMQSQNSLEW